MKNILYKLFAIVAIILQLLMGVSAIHHLGIESAIINLVLMAVFMFQWGVTSNAILEYYNGR